MASGYCIRLFILTIESTCLCCSAIPLLYYYGEDFTAHTAAATARLLLVFVLFSDVSVDVIFTLTSGHCAMRISPHFLFPYCDCAVLVIMVTALSMHCSGRMSQHLAAAR